MDIKFLIEEFYSIYRNEICSGKLIFNDKKWMKKRNRWVHLSWVLLLPLFYFAFMSIRYDSHKHILGIYAACWTAFPIFILYFIDNRYAKDRLRQSGIPVSNNSWDLYNDDTGYRRFKANAYVGLVKKQLDIDIELMTKDELGIFIDLFNKRAEDKKQASPFILKSLSPWISPMWSMLIATLISPLAVVKTDDPGQRLKTLLLLFVVVLAVWNIVSLLIWEIQNNKNKKSKYYREMAQILEEVLVNKLFLKNK